MKARHYEVDPAVVERILNHADYRLRANPAERIEALRRWTASGRAQNELERLTGWNVARDIRLHGGNHPAAVAAIKAHRRVNGAA